MRLSTFAVAGSSFCALLVACSSASSDPAGGSNQGAPASTAPPGETPADKPAPPSPARTKVISFLAESKEGQAPSLVSFENATPKPMTFWLGQIRFFAVKAMTSDGPDVGTSTQVEKDLEIGVHQEIDGSCVKLPLKAYEGPSVLVPGSSYKFRVTPDGDSFSGVLALTTPQQPFIAVRAEIHDASERASGSLRGSMLTIDLGDPPKPVEFETDEAERTGYLHAASAKRAASRVLFVEKSGVRFLATQEIDLSGAPGYTAIVDDKPTAGAAAVVTLTEDKK